jgi:hypothetical protein
VSRGALVIAAGGFVVHAILTRRPADAFLNVAQRR